MTKLVKVKIENKDIYMEIDIPEPKAGKEVKASAMNALKELDFEQVSTTINLFCDALIKSVKKPEVDKKLKEVNIEFGLNLGVESGTLTSYIVKGTGNASVKVKMKWEM